MGWLSKLFRAQDPIEEKLRTIYTPLYAGLMHISETEARAHVDAMLVGIKAETTAEGLDQVPDNFGDALLAKESSNPSIAAMLEAKRAEGVRDADIRQWLNMHYLERGMVLKVDELARITFFMEARKNGLSGEEAAREMWRSHPRFGAPEGQESGSPDDAPLPYELKDRINCYNIRRSQSDAADYKRDIESASTFNALIRREIRQGKV